MKKPDIIANEITIQVIAIIFVVYARTLAKYIFTFVFAINKQN